MIEKGLGVASLRKLEGLCVQVLPYNKGDKIKIKFKSYIYSYRYNKFIVQN